jgi:hypothetical protein
MVGHIREGRREGPRYGQVLSVSLGDGGNTLLGTVEFADAANAAYTRGEYDGWSVSIPRRGKDGRRYLHHLALLGETSPKIPELQELDSVSYGYADGDKVETYSFEGAIKERGDARVTEEEAKKLEAEKKWLEEENKKLLEEKEAREKADAAAQEKAAENPSGETPAADSKTTAAKTGDGEASEYADWLERVEGELLVSFCSAWVALNSAAFSRILRANSAMAFSTTGSVSWVFIGIPSLGISPVYHAFLCLPRKRSCTPVRLLCGET